MDYSKLPNSPPPYSENQRAPSAPPSDIINTAPLHGQPAPAPPVMVTNTTVVVGDQGLACPKCHARVHLSTKRQPSCKTYCLAAILCFFLCWPCVCLPCCCDCCYEIRQYCPNCKASMGTF